MTQFNIADVHSIGMYALETALAKLMPQMPEEGASDFREVLLEKFELEFYRCLVHVCDPVVDVNKDVQEPDKQLLLD